LNEGVLDGGSFFISLRNGLDLFGLFLVFGGTGKAEVVGETATAVAVEDLLEVKRCYIVRLVQFRHLVVLVEHCL
jgi:hypothetical protein